MVRSIPPRYRRWPASRVPTARRVRWRKPKPWKRKSPPPRRRRQIRRPSAGRRIFSISLWHRLAQAPAPVADLTLLLDAIQRGEPGALDALLAQVYAELRQLA